MTVTYNGHSCFTLNFGGHHVLIDPYISENALANDVIDVNSIQADTILISHGHFDHVADAAAIAKRTGAAIVANFEIASWFESKGLKNLHYINIGGSVNLPFGKVKLVNAVHSSVLPDGTYGGVAGGFVIENDETTLYYAGDTALTTDMQLLAGDFDFDHAFLPIGDTFTMGVDDAIRASQFVNCKSVIGMHYDTFPPIKIDGEEAKAKFESVGANLTLMKIGDTLEL
jgi:L-ascorbate metabolism protein UlaG (beta-lactamase superfamily)